MVNISQKDNKLIIEPAKKEKKYSIDELVNNLPKGYKASEEFSSKSGSEIW